MLNREQSISGTEDVYLPLKNAAKILDGIASWLVECKVGSPDSYLKIVESKTGKSREVLYATSLLRTRRQRELFLCLELFGEPAWDIMLDLFVNQEQGIPVSVSSLCIAASVPNSTAFRWIDNLTKQGIIIQIADPDDRRRTWVRLAPIYVDRMRKLLNHCVMKSISSGLESFIDR